MAIKFHLPNQSQTDIVANSFNGFPVATAAEFKDLLLAIGATKPGDPQPTALDTFLSSHPTAKAALAARQTAPVSSASLTYFGVNAFEFTNAKGVVAFGRYQLQPVAGEQLLSTEQVSTMGPDYLTDEIHEQVRRGPTRFKLVVQLAQQGDKIDDPSIAWPDTRKTVVLGTITITKAVAASQAVEKKLLFVPGAVVPGIEAADPMIAASFRCLYRFFAPPCTGTVTHFATTERRFERCACEQVKRGTTQKALGIRMKTRAK